MTDAAPTKDRRWLALALLAAAQFVVVLDASIVNVALPSIGRDLDFAQEDLSWVINAYTLFFGGFLLLGGRLADLLGRRRMFIVGLVLFALASLAGGLAQRRTSGSSSPARCRGSARRCCRPPALSLVITTFAEGAERNKALGVWGAVAGSGGAAGVLLGGVLTEALSWEWVLFVNVPIGIVVAGLAPMLLAESRSDAADRTFDIAGAVTVTAGLSILVYALVDAESAGWGSTADDRAARAVRRAAGRVPPDRVAHARPAAAAGIFRLRTLSASNGVGLLIGMSLFSMFFFLSLYMQQVLGYDAMKAGLSYLPLALTIIVSAGVASQLATKLGFKPVLMGGMLLVAAGLVWFSFVPVDGSYASDLLVPSMIAAAGLGFSFVPVTIGAVAGTKPHEAGLASGLINTSSRSAARSAWRSSPRSPRAHRRRRRSGERDPAVALTEGFQDAFLVGAGFALPGRDHRRHAHLVARRPGDPEAARRGEAPAAAAA